MLEGATRFEAMQMVEVLSRANGPALHPGRLTWNLLNNHLERKMIFQTSMVMFHVNLPGCKFGGNLVWEIQLIPMEIQCQFPFMKSNEVQGIQGIQGRSKVKSNGVAKGFLGGGFKYFLFPPLLGEDSQFD